MTTLHVPVDGVSDEALLVIARVLGVVVDQIQVVGEPASAARGVAGGWHYDREQFEEPDDTSSMQIGSAYYGYSLGSRRGRQSSVVLP